MRKLLFFVLLFSFVSLAFAQESVDVSDINESAVADAIGGLTGSQDSLGEDVGRAVGSSIAESVNPTLQSALAQVMEVANALVQIVIYGFLALAAVFFVWLVIVLVVLRNIMKREDLTGGEKAAWVLIVLFGGFIPFSIFGVLLYALSGGKKKKEEQGKK